MVQLRKWGWMHHLARHAVACYLTRRCMLSYSGRFGSSKFLTLSRTLPIRLLNVLSFLCIGRKDAMYSTDFLSMPTGLSTTETGYGFLHLPSSIRYAKAGRL